MTLRWSSLKPVNQHQKAYDNIIDIDFNYNDTRQFNTQIYVYCKAKAYHLVSHTQTKERWNIYEDMFLITIGKNWFYAKEPTTTTLKQDFWQI